MTTKLGRFVAIYGGWVVSSALGLLVFVLAREAIVNLTYRFVNKWAGSAVINWSTLVLGIAWLIGVIIIETYYREAGKAAIDRTAMSDGVGMRLDRAYRDAGRALLRRFLKVTGYEVLIAAIAMAITTLTTG